MRIDHELLRRAGIEFVEDRHRSVEFIGLLNKIDEHYAPEVIIRVVLDNQSAYLASRPGRFEKVHTPKHGSWLNLIECAFSKMVRNQLVANTGLNPR